VYALGALLYELLTGQPPFRAETALETLEQVRTQPPAPPGQRRPDVPAALQTICLKCLEKEPARRYPSAAALAADLRRYLAGEAIHARRPSRADRLLRWCRQPQRIRDAAIIGLTFSALALLWNLCGLTLMLLGLLPFNWGLILYLLVEPLIGHVPMFCASWLMLRQQGWAAIINVAIGSLGVARMCGALLGQPVPEGSGGLYEGRNPELELGLHILFLLFHLLVLLSSLIALAAYRASRSALAR
jgi:hypothetical protein